MRVRYRCYIFSSPVVRRPSSLVSSIAKKVLMLCFFKVIDFVEWHEIWTWLEFGLSNMYFWWHFLSFLVKIDIFDSCELDYRKSFDAMYLRVIDLIKPNEIWTWLNFGLSNMYFLGVFLSFLVKIDIFDSCELDYRKSFDAMYLREIALIEQHEVCIWL